MFYATHFAVMKILHVVPTWAFKPTWAFFDIAVGYFSVVAIAWIPAVIRSWIRTVSLSRFCTVAACFRALRPLVPFTPITMYCNPKKAKKKKNPCTNYRNQLCLFTSYIFVNVLTEKCFTQIPFVVWRANARIFVDAIHARAVVLTYAGQTVVYILLTIRPSVSQAAFACDAAEFVITRVISAWMLVTLIYICINKKDLVRSCTNSY